MGKRTDTSRSTRQKAPRRACRIAYTINNEQPVLCSIVSDQPLFYMDQEEIYEDDDILMDEDVLALDKDIQALKRKVEAYDRFSLEFSQPSDIRTQEFLQDSVLVSQPHQAIEADIEAILAELQASRMAAALLDTAEQHKLTIKFSTHVKTAEYDKNSNAVLVNPHQEKADILLLLTRELRRHWQHRQGGMINPLTFQPDEAILVNRAQIADLAVMMVRVAWELQLSGEKSVWERIENSTYADLGRTFAREAYVDFRTLNNGNACSAVFETWFLSDRCRQADKEIIQKMLADYEGLVFNTEGMSKSVTMELITALGSVPFGKNYLAPYASMILSDPIFTDVRDRSNANFLWFIKFEKSFRETEQELQYEESNQKPGARSGNTIINPEDTPYENAEIIPISIHRNQENKTRTKLDKSAKQADTYSNVVFLPFG
jgi:hypothetical protein